MFALEVVVRTHFLNELVVDAKEGDEDADDFEGFSTKPGSVGLGVLSEAGLRGVVQAWFGLLRSIGLFVLNSAIEGFYFFGIDGGLLGLVDLYFLLGMGVQRLLLQHFELHHFGWRYDADRDIAETWWIVPEVDSKRAVDVIHNFTSYQEAKLDCLDIEVEVAPPKDFFGLHGGF